MNYARTRRGLVVLVVLLVGLSLVAPVAVALGPHDGSTDGSTFGDGLSGSSNTSGSGGSSDLSSGSDDSLLSEPDSGPDSGGDTSTSGGDSSTSDTDPDSSSSLSNGGSSSSDSVGSDPDSSPDDGSDSSSFGSDADSDGDSDPIETISDDGTTLRESIPALLPDSMAEVATLNSDVGGSDLVDVDTTTSAEGTSYQVELVEFTSSGEAVLRLTASGGTTDGVATVLTTVSDTAADVGGQVTSGTSTVTDATGDSARLQSTEPASDPVPPVDDDTAALDPRASDTDGSGGDATDATRQNAIGFEAPLSPDDLPGGPAGTGAFVGLLGAAAAVAARQSGALSGMAGNLGTTVRTTTAAMPGSSYLDRLVRTLAPFRYSRYDDSDPLEHDAREAMFEVVEGSPGTYLSEIADRADIPLSTARHHIRVLEREDLVSGAKVRGKRRFYPAHTEGVELAAAMNDDSTAAVIDALARLGTASVSDLADELGKDPSTVTHHVQRLEEDEVVVRERDGRAVMNKLTAAARTMLEPDERAAEPTATGEAMASD